MCKSYFMVEPRCKFDFSCKCGDCSARLGGVHSIQFQLAAGSQSKSTSLTLSISLVAVKSCPAEDCFTVCQNGETDKVVVATIAEYCRVLAIGNLKVMR